GILPFWQQDNAHFNTALLKKVADFNGRLLPCFIGIERKEGCLHTELHKFLHMHFPKRRSLSGNSPIESRMNKPQTVDLPFNNERFFLFHHTPAAIAEAKEHVRFSEEGRLRRVDVFSAK